MRLHRSLAVGFVCLGSAGAVAAAQQQDAVIAAGVPLYVTTTATAAMHLGAPVDGVLTRAIWVDAQQVLPAGAPVHGVVTGLAPAPHEEHLKALLGGDLTPLHAPIVDFDSIRLPGGTLHFHTEARMRQTEMIRFVAKPHTSLAGKLVGMAKDRIHSTYQEVFGPGKKDRALRLLYNQLPYHPQRIWNGTEFVADLTAETPVAAAPKPTPPRVSDEELAASLPPSAVAEARLVTPLSSETAKAGEPVMAIVTRPLFDGRQRLLLAQGAELEGQVRQARKARSFGRNGTLRFSFRQIRRRGEEKPQQLFGTLSGVSGEGSQNLKVDAEGNVQAQPSKNRFIAPLILGVLATHGEDDDGGAGAQVVAANGLGLVARVVALTVSSRNVATGFGAYGFAKSIYFRFLTRGHAVTFPADTALEVQLSSR